MQREAQKDGTGLVLHHCVTINYVPFFHQITHYIVFEQQKLNRTPTQNLTFGYQGERTYQANQ